MRVNEYVPYVSRPCPRHVYDSTRLGHRRDECRSLHLSLTWAFGSPARSLAFLTKHPLRVHLVRKASERAGYGEWSAARDEVREEEFKKRVGCGVGYRGRDDGESVSTNQIRFGDHRNGWWVSPWKGSPSSTFPLPTPHPTQTRDASASRTPLRGAACGRCPHCVSPAAVATGWSPAATVPPKAASRQSGHRCGSVGGRWRAGRRHRQRCRRRTLSALSSGATHV